MLRKLLSLLSDSLVFGASTALAQLIQLLLLPVLTQFLTPVDYGVLDMLNIFMLLYVPIANVGMSNAIFRRFNTCKDEAGRCDVLSTGLMSVALSTLAFGAVAALFSGPLTDWIIGDQSLICLVWLTIGSAMLHSVQNIGVVILRADRCVKTVAMLSILKVFASVLPTVVLVTSFGFGVSGAVVGTFVGSVVGTIATFAVIRHRLSSAMSWTTWRGMLAFGLPFIPHHVQAVLLAVFGQMVVNQWLGREATGLYGMAMRFSLPFAFIVNSVQKAWVPFKFQIHAEDQDSSPAFFRGVVTYYLAGTTYLWLGVCLWGPLLLTVMTTAEFHAAAALIPMTALLPFCQGLYYMFGTGIELGDNTRSMPLVSGAGLATVVGGSLALVPLWGSAGAAAAGALGWTVMAVTIFFLSQREFRIHYDWPAIGAMAAVAALFVVGYAFAQQVLAIWALVGLALVLSLAYPGIVALILLRSSTERQRVRSLAKRLGKLRSARTKKSTTAVTRVDEPQFEPVEVDAATP